MKSEQEAMKAELNAFRMRSTAPLQPVAEDMVMHPMNPDLGNGALAPQTTYSVPSSADQHRLESQPSAHLAVVRLPVDQLVYERTLKVPLLSGFSLNAECVSAEPRIERGREKCRLQPPDACLPMRNKHQ